MCVCVCVYEDDDDDEHKMYPIEKLNATNLYQRRTNKRLNAWMNEWRSETKIMNSDERIILN